MDEIDMAAVIEELGTAPVTFLAPDAPERATAPAAWQPIVVATDSSSRRDAALALWSGGFRAMVPTFMTILAERLMDVRPCLLHGEWALVYFARSDTGQQLTWLGWDPASAGESRPVFWDRLPSAVQDFLSTTHAGFSAADGEAFGFTRPACMVTYAKFIGIEAGPIPGWNRPGRIDSQRLMFVTSNGDLLRYCVSPDLPPGQMAVMYDGDIEPEDFATALDNLMSGRFEDEE